jgi:hypothetical protein
MQTASVLVILSPENQQHKHGITPAEALLLRKLFFTNSQGAPLQQLIVNGGVTRTNTEEIARLKSKYTGIVEGVRVFEAVFGKGTLVQLPDTFDEIKEQLGEGVIVDAAPAPDAVVTDAHQWTPDLEAELVKLQTQYKSTKEQLERRDELVAYKATASNTKRK